MVASPSSMPEHPRGNEFGYVTGGLCALFVLSIILSWAFFRRTLLSGSVDMAHHGQLVDALAAHGQTLPRSVLSYMPSGMYTYPNIAHRVAALMVSCGFDIVRAMNALAVASALFVWTMLLDLQRRASKIAFFVTAAAAIAIAVRCFPLIGGEIVGNFFFAQLVGEAAFIACAIAIATLVSRPIAFAIAAAAAVTLCANIHFMLAVKIAGVALALWAVYLGVAWGGRRVKPSWAAPPVIITLSLLLNPQFALMKTAAGNNGDIGFGTPISIGLAGGLSGLLLLASAGPLLLALWSSVRARLASPTSYGEGVWTPAQRASTLVFSIGAATAAAALVQFLLFVLKHEGNEYAVRKWVFSVVSMLIVVLPLVLARALPRRPLRADQSPPWAERVWPAGSLALGLLIVAVLFHRPNVIDVVQFVGLSRETQSLRKTLGVNSSHDAAFASSALPQVESFFNTLVVLHDSQDREINNIITQGKPLTLTSFKYILAPRGDEHLDVLKCHVGYGTTHVVVVSGDCLTRSMPPEGLSPEHSIAFKRGESSSAYLSGDWSAPEAEFVWSQGREMNVRAPLAPGWSPSGPQRIVISTSGFVAPASPERHVTLTAKGAPPSSFTFTAANTIHDFVIVVDGAALALAGSVDLRFSVANPISPAQVGLGGDGRQLGLKMTRIAVLPER